MAGQIVDEQYFHDIANAIRNKNGESTLYKPKEMALAISNIESGMPSTSIDFLNKTVTNFTSTVTLVKEYAFYKFASLVSISLPNATRVSKYAFRYCTSLANVNVPSLTTIDDSGFMQCSLISITLPSIASIGNSAFEVCSELTTITLPGSTVCTLGTRAFTNTSITNIYVPAELVDTYKAATNWSSYASKISAIPNE